MGSLPAPLDAPHRRRPRESDVQNRLRIMNATDAAAVAEVQKKAYAAEACTGAAAIGKFIALHQAGCAVIEAEGRIIGYVLSHPAKAAELPPAKGADPAEVAIPDTYYVADVAVRSDERGRGVGIALLRHAISSAARCKPGATLHLTAFFGVHTFWEKYTFKVLGEVELKDNVPAQKRLESYPGHWSPRLMTWSFKNP